MSKITLLTNVEIDVNEALNEISLKQIFNHFDPDEIMAMAIHKYGEGMILNYFSAESLIEHAGAECSICQSALGKEVL